MLGFHLLGKKGHYRLTIGWLVAASLFFYGWWNPIYLGLLVGSVLFNYAFGFVLLNRPSKLFLFLGIIGNLGALGYFKYGNFFVDNINVLFNNNIIFSLGPAGTGKTFLAVAVAVNQLISGKVNKIILSRPAVEAGENLGFLPGDLKEKIEHVLNYKGPVVCDVKLDPNQKIIPKVMENF